MVKEKSPFSDDSKGHHGCLEKLQLMAIYSHIPNVFGIRNPPKNNTDRFGFKIEFNALKNVCINESFY